MRLPTGLSWILVPLGTLLLATAAQAETSVILDPGPNGPNPSSEAVIADGDVLFVGRADGWITAVDRSTGAFAWETLAAGVDPGSIIVDMVDDSQTLYAVLHDDSDNDAEPVVAVRKSDGAILWNSRDAHAGMDQPHFGDNAFRVAVDQRDPDAADALFVGLDHGRIAKIHKADGTPFLRFGAPVVLDPRDQDADSANPQEKHLSAILAMEVYDDNVFAYRRFGGILAENNQWAPYLFLGEDHVMYWLDAELQGHEDIRLPPFTLADGNASRPVYPGVSDIHARPLGDDVQVTLGGIGDPDSGIVLALRASGAPDPSNLALIAYTAVSTPLDLTYPVPNNQLRTPEDETQLLVWTLAGAGDTIYAGTWESSALDLNAGNNGDTGYIFKLDAGTLAPVGGTDGWPTGADTDGRRTHAGRVLTLDVADDGDTLFAGHISQQSPHPGIRNPDGSVLPHVEGALVQEVPTDGRPMANLLRPWGFEQYTHTAAVALRADHPGDDGRPTKVSLQYRPSDCPAAQASCWTRIPEVVIAFPGDGYLQTNNVDLDFPDGKYRVRVVVEDHLGRTYWDESDYDFTVDKTPPVLGAASPADGAVVTTCQPTFEVGGADATSGIDRDASFLFIDVRQTAYPYLEFQGPAGEETGFRLDLAELDPGQETPPGCLAEGAHLVHAEFVDRAGNFAFKEWTIHVDSRVHAPSFDHLDRQWFRSAQPQISAQFLERIHLDAATLDGVDARGRVHVIDPHPSLNPQGTRLVFQPSAPLADGEEYTLTYHVTDTSGNAGGPFTTRFRVDTLTPTFDDAAPIAGRVIAQARPTIGVDFGDPGGSGLVLADVEVRIDGFPAPATVRTDGFRHVPATPLASGTHTVWVRATDVAGNQAEFAWDFMVDLGSPGLDVTLELPAGQQAVKQGDTVRVLLQASDDSPIAAASVDATGLDPALSAAEPATPVDGAPGRYEFRVTVAEAGTRPVVLRVAVEDSGGSRTERPIEVLLDNEPPIAFMKDLPRQVGSTFLLEWTNSPADDLRGSGVAYYILEQLQPDGTYAVLRERVEADSILLTYPDAEPADLAYRVVAVDHAGNRQAEPSNVVVTTALGDPFERTVLPAKAAQRGVLVFSATPRSMYEGDNATAFISLVHESGSRYDFPLERVGTVFTGQANLTALAAGGYTARFHLVDADGLETAGGLQTLQVVPEEIALDASPAPAKDSPSAVLPVLAVALLLASAIRRRR